MIENRFVTVVADGQVARDIHFNLRYKVFCDETGFENADRFPDQKEHDEFDPHATHFIIWDRLDRQWVGAMRLVDAAKTQLPCELICSEPLEDLEPNRKRSREFSRLCILSKYRHTPRSEAFGSLALNSNPDAERVPAFIRQEDHEILMRLLWASFAWGKSHDFDYCYFIVNAALARVLKRFGIPLTVVGHQVRHRGARIPHRFDLHEAQAGMIEKLPGFSRLVRNGPAYVPYEKFIAHRAETRIPEPAQLPCLPLSVEQNSLQPC